MARRFEEGTRFDRLRTLKDRLMPWLAGKIGVGPALGNVKYVAVSGGLYEDNLLYAGIKNSDIYTSLSEAEDSCTAYQNDVVCITPGAHVETEEIAWDKAHTHIVGLGGPNIGGDYSEYNCVVYTVTSGVGSVLTVTGQYSQFHDFVVENNYSHATNLTAATINTYGTYWKNVAFHGNMQANQNATAACASLYIGAAGMYPLLEDCIIGQDVWGTRAAANSGVLRFSGTGGRPNGGIFRRCQFLSTGSTVTCAMVAIPAATSSGRGWLFDSCSFQHFNDAGVSLNQAFYSIGTSVQKHTMLLKNCVAFGIDEWQDADDDVVLATMPITGLGGGLHREPTGTAGN